MSFDIDFTESALHDLKKHKKAGNLQLLRKIDKLLEELRIHPTTGTGKPEQLRYRDSPTWSRRISDKHRMVYEIQEQRIVVLVLSFWGHYTDT